MSHVMVCGFGEVGYQAVNLLLNLGEEVTVVSLAGREEWLNDIKQRGAKVFLGDARNEKFLVQAGLLDVDAVLACVHNDGTNIEIALDVQKLCPNKRTIARIIDPSLARHAEKHLSVHRAIAMTAAAAPTFAAATFGDSVLTELNINHERFLALKLEGPQHLTDKPLVAVSASGECRFDERKELEAGETAVVMTHSDTLIEKAPKHERGYSLLKSLAPTAVFKFVHNVWMNTSVQLRAVLIAIFTVIIVSVVVFQNGMKLSLVDSLYFTITTATTTGYGDLTPKDSASWVKLYTCGMMVICSAGMAVLFSVVTDYILTARMLQLRGHHHVPEHGHVIVVGVGTVGFRTVEELIRLKTPLVAIEQTEDSPYLSHIRAKTHVIIGDGRETETLIRAGVEHAKAIIALTPSDAVNLGVGLTAKELNPRIRVILSIFDADFAEKVCSIAEIDSALSAPVLAAPSFVGAALYDNSVASFLLGSMFFTICKDDQGKIKIGDLQMSLEVRKLL
jgi:Trk K+ transport system NAD-binding subunit